MWFSKPAHGEGRHHLFTAEEPLLGQFADRKLKRFVSIRWDLSFFSFQLRELWTNWSLCRGISEIFYSNWILRKNHDKNHKTKLEELNSEIKKTSHDHTQLKRTRKKKEESRPTGVTSAQSGCDPTLIVKLFTSDFFSLYLTLVIFISPRGITFDQEEIWKPLFFRFWIADCTAVCPKQMRN